MADFGVCDCGGSLIPVWFTEEETKVANGIYVYGGFETGGLVGNSQKGSEFNVKDSKITINKVEFANLDKGTGTWFGVGGIVGSANIKTTISNVRLTSYNKDSFIGSKKDNKPLATQTISDSAP